MKLSDEEKEMEEPEEEERPDEPPSKTPPPRTSQETAETSAGSKDTPSCPAPEDVMAVVRWPFPRARLGRWSAAAGKYDNPRVTPSHGTDDLVSICY